MDDRQERIRRMCYAAAAHLRAFDDWLTGHLTSALTRATECIKAASDNLSPTLPEETTDDRAEGDA